MHRNIKALIGRVMECESITPTDKEIIASALAFADAEHKKRKAGDAHRETLQSHPPHPVTKDGKLDFAEIAGLVQDALGATKDMRDAAKKYRTQCFAGFMAAASKGGIYGTAV